MRFLRSTTYSSLLCLKLLRLKCLSKLVPLMTATKLRIKPKTRKHKFLKTLKKKKKKKNRKMIRSPLLPKKASRSWKAL